jgi:hypothetical protein
VIALRDLEFIKYIGDYRVHDSVIEEILEKPGSVTVILRSIDQELIKLIFDDVKEVKANKAKGMMLYSISEMSGDEAFRCFVFMNWDDASDASFEIAAKDFRMID